MKKENIKEKIKSKERLKEFKKFAFKGNIFDLSVGVLVGTAFSKIVTSLSNDILVPLISLLTKNVKFEELYISLNGIKYETLAAAKEAGAITLNYGNFLAVICDFFITAIVIFIAVKQVEKIRFKKQISIEDTQASTTKKCFFCKSDIPIDAIKCPHCTSDLKETN